MSETPDDIRPQPPAAADEPLQTLRIRVRRNLPGRRLDKYLHSRYPHMSRTTIQRLIRQGAVRVNDQPAKASYEVRGGDVIELTIPEPQPTELTPEPIPIEIIYEDEHLIAINKQAGIICHPAHTGQSGTLANALAWHAEKLSRGSEPFRPGIVHRLDKNTTGVMLVAKTDEAHWRLALQFERRTVQKIYLAVVEGVMQLDADVIDAPIGVHPVVREKFAVMVRHNKIDIGKQAVTRYEVAERYRRHTLVRLYPKTGRTHQLRVHMSWIGHPIVGDLMYGGRPVSERSLTGRGSDEVLLKTQALHAWRIEFTHPITEAPMQIEAPPPEPMRRLIELLRADAQREPTDR